MAIDYPTSLDTFSDPNPTSEMSNPSHSGLHTDINSAVEALETKVGIDGSADTNSLDYKIAQAVTLSGSETLTNKTLTSPTIDNPLVNSTRESWDTGGVFDGTLLVEANIATAYYLDYGATNHFEINIVGDSGTTLNSSLSVGHSYTVVIISPNGSTPYFYYGLTIDGTSVTPVWQGGTAPIASTANETDIWVLTVIKTSSIPTYAVFGSFTQFS